MAMTDALFSRRLEAMQRNFWQDIRSNILNGTNIKSGTVWYISQDISGTSGQNEDNPIGGNYSDINTAYPYLVTGETLTIASSQAINDSALGTGVREVDLWGFSRANGGSYVFQRITPGNTTTGTYNAVMHMQGFTWGSSKQNAGNITATPVTSTNNKMGQIVSLDNIAKLPVFAAASGYEAWIKISEAATTVAPVTFHLNTVNGEHVNSLVSELAPAQTNANRASGWHYLPENHISYVACFNGNVEAATTGVSMEIIIRKK